MPAGASEPLHFRELFKAVVAGPAVWTARQRDVWDSAFDFQQRHAVPKPSYNARRRTVEAARRAFSCVARMRREYFGKCGVTYNLASTAVLGW